MNLDAALQLLDRQLVDRDGWLVGKVDDLELAEQQDGSLLVTAILTGPGALGPRFPGVLGRAILALWHRLSDDADPQPGRIEFAAVRSLGSAVTLSIAMRALPSRALERWARDRIIGKLPGAGHAPE
jgi:hypothetical protein